MKLLLENDKKSIYWRELSERDYDSVKKVILEKVIKDEPVYAMLQPTVNNFLSFELPRLPELLKHGLSIGAFDEINGEHLIGMSLISIKYPSNKTTSYLDNDVSENDNNFGITAVRFFNEVNCGIEKYINNEKYLMIEESAVIDNYCKMGIMTNLIKKAELIAKEHDCKKIFCLLTSKFTQMICEKIGYSTLNEVKYSDYIDVALNRNPFKAISSIHQSAKLVCLELD